MTRTKAGEHFVEIKKSNHFDIHEKPVFKKMIKNILS